MRCEYCGTENEIPEELLKVEEHSITELPLMPALAQTGFGAEKRSFKCKHCGAVQSVDPKYITTRCVFCGSDTVFETPSNPNITRPTALVPFVIGSEDTQRKYKDWLKGLWFRPNDLKKRAALTNLKGIYAPFFTFDVRAESDWSGWRGTYYYTTQAYVTFVNGRPVTRTRRVRHVRWDYHYGHHSAFYDDILVNASRGLPEDILKKIYPYNLKQLVGYSSEYLAGFGAEEYTVDPSFLWEKAKHIAMKAEWDACSTLLDGDTQRGLHVQTQLLNPKWKHILLPVYVASYLYHGRQYNFLVNGQTGEVQGEAPLSWAKIGAVLGGIIGLIIAIVLFVLLAA